MNKYFLLALMFVIAACSSGNGDDATSSMVLDGTWTGDIMTVTIDFDAGTYEGTGLGTPFSCKLALIEDNGDSVVFRIDEKTVVAEIVDDDNIILTTQDADGNSGIPVKLTRER
jgi:hypothetical protein